MRKTHHHRGKSLSGGAKLGGKRQKQHNRNAPDQFAVKPKSTEPDNVGRKVRPAAHNAKQSAVAARARSRVRRLSDQMI